MSDDIDTTKPATHEERLKHPKYYWCVREEGQAAQYFWEEEPVSEEEYKLGTGGDTTCD